MKYKILIVALIGFIGITAFSSNLNRQMVACSNNAYGSVEQLEEKNQQEVKKDKYDMITGKIKEIVEREDKRSLLIQDEKGFEYLFHINEHTIIMTFENLKIDQNVDIIFNGILTSSIPPQGNAIIVNGLKV